MTTSHLNSKWAIRRRTMHIALAAGLLYPLLVRFSDPVTAGHLVGLGIPFYGFVTFIVTTYTAGVTWEENQPPKT